MGDPACEPAQGLDLLHLPDLLRQQRLMGHVVLDDHVVEDPARFVIHGRDRRLELEPFTVLSLPGTPALPDPAVCERAVDIPGALAVLPDEVQGLAHQLVRPEPGDPLHRGIHVLDRPPAVGDDDHVSGVLHRLDQPLALFLQSLVGGSVHQGEDKALDLPCRALDRLQVPVPVHVLLPVQRAGKRFLARTVRFPVLDRPAEDAPGGGVRVQVEVVLSLEKFLRPAADHTEGPVHPDEVELLVEIDGEDMGVGKHSFQELVGLLQIFLGLLLGAHVGDHAQKGGDILDPERGEGHEGMDILPSRTPEHDLGPPGAAQVPGDEALQLSSAGRAHVIAQRRADQPFQRHAQHAGELPVAVEDYAFLAHRHRSFAHLFNDDAVRTVGLFEGKDLRALRARHHDCIDLALPDGVQIFLGLMEAHFQIVDLREQIVSGFLTHDLRSALHDAPVHELCACLQLLGLISMPLRTCSMSERSPINFLKGRGSLFTRVGVTTMSAFCASSGCW